MPVDPLWPVLKPDGNIIIVVTSRDRKRISQNHFHGAGIRFDGRHAGGIFRESALRLPIGIPTRHFWGSVTRMVIGRLGRETSVLGRSVAEGSLLKGTWDWPRTAMV